MNKRLAEMKEAKRRLYLELLKTPHGQLSEIEVELAFQLALDPQIKELLDERLRAEMSAAHGYAPGLEINEAAARLFPNNCAVIVRTGDGISVGACTHYLRNGTDCPRHGRVKAHNTLLSDAGGENLSTKPQAQ